MTGTPIKFAEKIALDVWDDQGLFTTGRTVVTYQVYSDITWTDRSGYYSNQAGYTDLSDLKYEIRNNTRMKDES